MKSLQSQFTSETLSRRSVANPWSKRGARSAAILHRVLAVVCMVALAGASALLAQRSRQRSSGPRAVGLLEVAANGRARLVPVAILINGRFYDADLYRADPRPMALIPETVYEIERGGASVGLFTVTKATLYQDVWVGVGQWRPHDAEQPRKTEAKAEPSKKPAPSAALAESDDRPILRKPKSETDTTTPPAPAATSAPAPTPAPAAPAESKIATQTQPKAAPSDDFERPTLRRGKPAQKQAEDETAPFTTAKPGTVSVSTTVKKQSTGSKPASDQVEVMTAVSDADGPEPRSYLFPIDPPQRTKFETKTRAMAYEAVQKFSATRPQSKPAAAGQLQVTDFQVFDVHYNNQPVVVLSASIPALRATAPRSRTRTQRSPEPAPPAEPADLRYFVTVVARQDMYGELHRLFAEVTDSSRLDTYPHMELIDAVDAEGAGTGQLLFRNVSEAGFSYTIYRVGADKLWPLFTTETKPF